MSWQVLQTAFAARKQRQPDNEISDFCSWQARLVCTAMRLRGDRVKLVDKGAATVSLLISAILCLQML